MFNNLKKQALVLTDSFTPCPFAATQRIDSFVNSMTSCGMYVTVITLFRCLKKRRIGKTNKSVLIYNFRYPVFLLRASVVMVNPIPMFLLLFGAIATTMARRPQFILASVPQGEVAIVGFLISKLFSIPLVTDLRDWYPISSKELSYFHIPRPRILNEFLIILFGVIYRQSQKILSVNKEIRNRLLTLGISSAKIHIVPNGANIQIYKPSSPEKRAHIRSNYGLSKAKTIFVYAGSLSKIYPVIDVIKGVNELSKRREDFQLLIISHSDYFWQLNYVNENELDEFVKFLGPLPVIETARIISACDVGIVPYGGDRVWKNTYGSKITSYMSCGLPILASGPEDSVISTLLLEHEVGFFVGKPSAYNFLKGFLFFLDNKKRIRNMNQNARELTKRFYDRERIAFDMVSSISTEVLELK